MDKWIKTLGLQDVVKKNYHLFATTGGGDAFEERRYDIYLRNDQMDKNFSELPPMKNHQLLEPLVQLLKGNLRQPDKWVFLKNVGKDVLWSFVELPSDIGLAGSRLFHMAYETRCSSY